MWRFSYLLPLALLIVGCGRTNGVSGTPTGSTTPKAHSVRPARSPITTLDGPGGAVSLGDSLADAKRAFPTPAGAIVFDRAMNYAILTPDGWAWSTAAGSNGSGFEAAVRDGWIVAFARTRFGAKDEPASTIKALGKPSRQAVGKTVSMYVWDAGDEARILLVYAASSPIIPAGALTMIGDRKDLTLLNYRADDPAAFVNLMDSSAKMANSPEMEKVFEDAKQRALKKTRDGS